MHCIKTSFVRHIMKLNSILTIIKEIKINTSTIAAVT